MLETQVSSFTMASEDFIELSSGTASDVDASIASSQLAGDNTQPNNSDKEGKLIPTCIDGVGDNRAAPVLQEIPDIINPNDMEDNASTIHTSPEKENGYADTISVGTMNDHLTDGSSVPSRKRVRLTHVDNQPSVHVVYTSLTRESKRKLKGLLQQWSEWQAMHELPSNSSSSATLECGEETYFPAIHVGKEKSSMVSFWVDNQARNEETTDHAPIDIDSVPLYDRGFVLPSNSVDGSYNSDRFGKLEDSRCFNCGSYGHSLKECPRPHDNVAISNARKQHSSKKPLSNNARGQARYYEDSPGKFGDLKAGVLGPETRQFLGIGEFDPPPWLQRMREIGYPPGYLDIKDEESQPSGITIFVDEEAKVEFEEGELPEQVQPVPPEKEMTVEFPGINAPIPENADHRQWAAAKAHSPSSEPWRKSQRGSGRSSEEIRNSYHPADNGVFSRHGYLSRYSAYDRHRPPISPSVGRLFSDSEWRSHLHYDLRVTDLTLQDTLQTWTEHLCITTAQVLLLSDGNRKGIPFLVQIRRHMEETEIVTDTTICLIDTVTTGGKLRMTLETGCPITIRQSDYLCWLTGRDGSWPNIVCPTLTHQLLANKLILDFLLLVIYL